jgi:hypothetical protein
MKRAFIWCGVVRGEKKDHWDTDFATSVHDIDLTVAAARALGVQGRDIWVFGCRDDLLPHGFTGTYLPATIDHLARVAADLAAASQEEDRLLFLATNHGDVDGLVQYTPPFDPYADAPLDPPDRLTPEQLRRHLDLIRGQQVVIIGACHAGTFLSIGEEARRLVLGACAPDRVIYSSNDPQPRTPFIDEFLAHWAGVTLNSLAPPPRQSLDQAFAFVLASPPRRPRTGEPIKPERRGSAAW